MLLFTFNFSCHVVRIIYNLYILDNFDHNLSNICLDYLCYVSIMDLIICAMFALWICISTGIMTRGGAFRLRGRDGRGRDVS